MKDAAETEDTSDAAAAFADLEAKVDRVLDEVRGLTKRLPDIADSVRAFEQHADQTKQSIAAVLAQPALKQTPTAWVDAVNHATAEGQKTGNAQLQSHLGQAQTVLDAARDTGQSYLFYSSIGNIVLGVVAAASLLTAWHYADLVSTFRAETADKWAAGSKFLQEAHPTEWNFIVRSSKLRGDTLAAFEACREVATTTGKPQPCKLIVEPENK